MAVGRGDGLLGAEELAMAHGQAEALLPMIDRVMRAVPLQPAALDIVAATVGPGSFTGIRVGLAAARGIALACGAPLVGVTAFVATAGAVASDRRGERDALLIALESRRADLFVQLLDPALRPLSEPAALPPEALGDFVAAAVGDGALLIAGDAAQRAADALLTRRIQIRAADIRAAGALPRAAGALRAALACWRRGERGDARPLYLRPPAVTLAAPSPRRSGC